jgi:Domain of unknown function (DUF4350)
MTTNVRIAIVVGAVLLALAQFFIPEEDPRLADPTTYGTGPMGYRAAYDLVSELGYPIRRHEAPIADLATGGTAWWIAPSGVCAGRSSETAWGGGGWVLGGGTAVVWLPESGSTTSDCALADLAVPARSLTRRSEAVEAADPDTPSRDPGVSGMALFADVPGWSVIVQQHGRPLVIEHPLGAGRVVLVADARPIRNWDLEHGDAAPLLVDVVRRYGAPSVVEPPPPPLGQATRSVGRYLAHSPAAIPLAGLIATGLLLVWRGMLVPPRTLDDADPAPPTLQHFVDGLARLYAGTRDYGRMLVRYRQLSASRLRRHLGLPVHASVDAIVARIGRTRTLPDDPRALLDGPLRVATSEDLRAAVGRLDALVAEVIG